MRAPGPVGLMILVCFVLMTMFGACQQAEPVDEATKSHLFPILKDGKWGFMNYQGNVVIEPAFESAPDLSEIMPRLEIPQSAYIMTDSSVYILESALKDEELSLPLARLWAFELLGQHYDLERNEMVVNRKLRSIGDFDDMLAPVLRNGKWGFINKTGEVIVPFEYDVAKPFSEGLAAVFKQGIGWRFITHEGKPASINTYEEVGSFSEGLARARINGKWGFVDKTGNWVIAPRLEFAGDFSEGKALFKHEGRSGFIDTTSNLVVPPKFNRVQKISEGMMAYETERGWWGYANPYGSPLIDPQFDDAGPFSEGKASVRIGKHYGFIDKKGKIIVEPAYIFAYPFKEGLAPVKKGAHWGYVNETGEMVISPRFDWAYPFRHGIAPVETNGKLGYIDKQGNYVWTPTR